MWRKNAELRRCRLAATDLGVGRSLVATHRLTNLPSHSSRNTHSTGLSLPLWSNQCACSTRASFLCIWQGDSHIVSSWHSSAIDGAIHATACWGIFFTNMRWAFFVVVCLAESASNWWSSENWWVEIVIFSLFSLHGNLVTLQDTSLLFFVRLASWCA